MRSHRITQMMRCQLAVQRLKVMRWIWPLEQAQDDEQNRLWVVRGILAIGPPGAFVGIVFTELSENEKTLFSRRLMGFVPWACRVATTIKTHCRMQYHSAWARTQVGLGPSWLSVTSQRCGGNEQLNLHPPWCMTLMQAALFLTGILSIGIQWQLLQSEGWNALLLRTEKRSTLHIEARRWNNTIPVANVTASNRDRIRPENGGSTFVVSLVAQANVWCWLSQGALSLRTTTNYCCVLLASCNQKLVCRQKQKGNKVVQSWRWDEKANLVPQPTLNRNHNFSIPVTKHMWWYQRGCQQRGNSNTHMMANPEPMQTWNRQGKAAEIWGVSDDRQTGWKNRSSKRSRWSGLQPSKEVYAKQSPSPAAHWGNRDWN